MFVDATLTLPQLPPPTSHVLKSIRYGYVFIPALPLGSSVPTFFFFLDSIYMRYILLLKECGHAFHSLHKEPKQCSLFFVFK